MGDYEKALDFNALRLGILMNFPKFCGEERTKEAMDILNKIIAELDRHKKEAEKVWRICGDYYPRTHRCKPQDKSNCPKICPKYKEVKTDDTE
jgi:hypothetical protein